MIISLDVLIVIPSHAAISNHSLMGPPLESYPCKQNQIDIHQIIHSFCFQSLL